LTERYRDRIKELPPREWGTPPLPTVPSFIPPKKKKSAKKAKTTNFMVRLPDDVDADIKAVMEQAGLSNRHALVIYMLRMASTHALAELEGARKIAELAGRPDLLPQPSDEPAEDEDEDVEPG
jgi:hypothetical protein